MMDPAKVLILLQWAASLAGYPLPDAPPPTVYELTTKGMHEQTCPKFPKYEDECFSVVGIFDPDRPNSIYVDAEYTRTKYASGDEDSVVVHELVHYLQWQNGIRDYHCPRAAVTEFQAYRAENLYIIAAEHKGGLADMPSVCGVQYDLLTGKLEK